jgi:uncharacterized repeat protein (TIGR01451 family)
MQTSHRTDSFARTILNGRRGRMAALFTLIAVAALVAVTAFSLVSLAKKKKARSASAGAVASSKAFRRDSAKRERRERAEKKKGTRGEVAEREGGEPEGSRYEALLEQEAYWAARVTYPTGNFDPAWVREAARQDSEVERALPAGAGGPISSRLLMSQSPLALSTTGFTALGPMPEKMTGCASCFDYGTTAGRVNSIAIDPTTTTNGSVVAYIATVGGGVWKTTNCCSVTTTWSPTTDDATIGTQSIDTVTIDPSNHDTIYAGTGDLNFGSFSMGSQGILKSTDAGATWSVLGADVFVAALPEPAGQFPQYNAVGKVRVDPNNSSNVVAGTKLGLYVSNDGGANWAGPCLTNAFATQRQDITGLELTNIGGTTRILAAVGTRGFATPVQYNLDQNGANGLYKGTIPASGCPTDFALITSNANGFNYGAAVTGSPYLTGANMNAGTGTPYGGNTTTGNQLGRMDIAVAPSNPNYIYAQVGSIVPNSDAGCGGAAGCQLGVWSSIDGGGTWTFMAGSQGGALRNCVGGNTNGNPGDYPQNWYDQGMAVDPNNPDRLFIDTYDTWLATRTGTSFYNVTCGYNGTSFANHVVHVDHHALAFVSGSSSVLLEGSDGGIFSTSNADAAVSGVTRPTWVNMDTGLNTIEFYSGDISGFFATSATPSAAGGAQDNGPSTVLFSGTPSASQWQMGTGGDGFFARIDPVGTGTSPRYWLGNNSGGLSRCIGVNGSGNPAPCTSGGATWSNKQGGWTGDQQSFVLPFELFHGDVNNPANDCGAPGAGTGCGHLVAGTVRVWETITGAAANTSGTVTWYVNSPDNLTKATLGNRSYINQLAFEPSDQTTVIVGTNDGNVQIGRGLGTGAGPRRAAGTITMSGTGIPLANETFVIGSQTFTWKASRTTTGDVTIGTSTTTSATNIVTAITADLAGVVTAARSGSTVVVTAANTGAAGNSITFTEASTNMTMNGSGTLGGTTSGSDGVAVWTNVTDGNNVLPNRPVLDVAFDPKTTTAPVGYAAVGGFDQNTPATPGHVFQVTCTTNCATYTWANKSGNLPNIPVDSIIANPNFPQQVFAGTDFGLYYTDDVRIASPVWYRFNVGLPNVMIWDMAIDRGNTTLALFTRGRGAYAWPLPSAPVMALPTAISAVSGSGVYGGTGTLTATLTEGGFPLAGKSIDFTLANMSVGSAVTDANGVATLSGVSVAGFSAGSNPGAVGASFAGDSGYQPSNNSGTLTIASAVLSIDMIADRDPAPLEQNFNYKATITNTGDASATNTVLTDVLPAGVTFTAASATQGTCSYAVATRTVTCNIGTIGTASNVMVTITVKPRSEGTLDNTAFITAGQWDPDTGNDNAAVNGLVVKKYVDLAVSAAGSASPVFAGENVTYTIVVKNINVLNGATGVVLTDTLAASATYVSSTTSQGSLVTPPVGSTGTVTANLGTIASGASATVTVTVKSSVSGAMTNTATASSNEADTNTANNTASTTTTVKDAALLKVLLASQSLIGGCQNTTGNVYLTGPAGPGGVTVPLASSISGASVPASVFIPAGSSVSPAFNVMTVHVAVKQVGVITAGSGAGSVSRGITINPGSCPP